MSVNLAKLPNLPMAEVFGYRVDDFSAEAVAARKSKYCPFLKAKCNKVSASDPLGVCSMNYKGKVVISCPSRFEQDGKVAQDIQKTCFKPGEPTRYLSEVPLRNGKGESAGNIDHVVQSRKDPKNIIPVEIQATYATGAVRNSFAWYMKDPIAGNQKGWPSASWPRPDFLSSSRKRLMPQLMIKGNILVSGWGKRQAVVVDRSLFDTLPALVEVSPLKANLIWFVYRLEVQKTGPNKLVLDRTVYTDFEQSMLLWSRIDGGTLDDFLIQLDKKSK